MRYVIWALVWCLALGATAQDRPAADQPEEPAAPAEPAQPPEPKPAPAPEPAPQPAPAKPKPAPPKPTPAAPAPKPAPRPEPKPEPKPAAPQPAAAATAQPVKPEPMEPFKLIPPKPVKPIRKPHWTGPAGMLPVGTLSARVHQPTLLTDRGVSIVAVLVSLSLAVCGVAAGLALAADWRASNGGAQARFARLCFRAAAGEAVVVTELLRLAAEEQQAGLPRSDLVAALALAGARGEKARGLLAVAVERGQGEVRRLAAEALAGQAEQPDPALWPPLLRADERSLRGFALRALGAAPRPEALADLRGIASGHDAELAPRAVDAIAAAPGGEAASVLLAVAREAELPASREAAATALAARRGLPPALAPELAELLAEPGRPGRPALAAALAGLGNDAREALFTATLDDDPAVRRIAAEALLDATRFPARGDLAAAFCQRLRDEPEALSLEALEVAAAWSPTDAVPVLALALRCPGDDERAWTLRRAAVAHLAASSDPQADRILGKALAGASPTQADTPERELVQSVCQALAARGVNAVVPLLLERSAIDRDDPTAFEAARRLAVAPGAGAYLAAAAGHASRRVRRRAIHLLAEYPADEAADALLAELARESRSEAEWDSKEQAARALASLGEARALEPLRALHEECDGPRRDVLDAAMARLGDVEARRRVEAMLVRETWAERRPAAEFFRYLQQSPPRAAAVVREAHAHRRAEALVAAGQATPHRLAELGEMVEPTLREWLWSGQRRSLAAEALGLLGDPQAMANAAELDRVDALLAQRAESPEARAALAEAARAGSDELRFYVARVIGQDELAALMSTGP